MLKMGKSAGWIKKIFGLKKSLKSPLKEKSNQKGKEQDKTIKFTISNENQHTTIAAAQIQLGKDHLNAVEVGSNVENQQSIEVKQAPVKIAVGPVEAFSLPSSSHMAVESSLDEGSCADRDSANEGAVKIRTAFDRFFAHQHSSAYKGLVKLQALVRGHLVRKQAALALQCILAIVKVQAHIRGYHVRMPKGGQEAQKILCSGCHSAPECKSWEAHALSPSWALQSKGKGSKDGNMVLASAFQRQLNLCPSKFSLFNLELGESVSGWYWLEFWTAAQPWAILSVSEENVSSSNEVGGHLENRHATTNGASEGRSNHGLRVLTGSMSTWLSEPKRLASFTVQSELSDHFTESAAVDEVTSFPSHRLSPFSESQSFNRSVPTEMVNEKPVLIQKDNQHARITNSFSVTNQLKSSMTKGLMKALKIEHVEEQIQGSPAAIPSYMAATESAKAKSRANSTPRNRPNLPEYLPPVYKRRLSLPGSNGGSTSIVTHSQRWNSNVKIKDTDFISKRLPSSLRNISGE